MVQALDSNPLYLELEELAGIVGPLSDAMARSFLQRHSFDDIFRQLSAPEVTYAVIENARSALEKVLNTSFGLATLPELVPYAAAALQSAKAPLLRQLAVQQLSRLVAQRFPLSAGGSIPQHDQPQEVQQQELLRLLLGALSDEDVGVAVEAERALSVLGGAPAALAAQVLTPPASQQLLQLTASLDPLVSIRALTLVLRLAAHSPQAAAVVRGAGLLDALLGKLQRPDDVLGCTAALQLVQEGAEECDPGMAAALSHAVLPSLAVLVQRGGEPVLQCASLQAGAALLSACLEGEEGGMEVDPPQALQPGAVEGGGGEGGRAGCAAASPLLVLSWLKEAVDVGGREEVAAEVEEAALDAVGSIGLRAGGAAAVLLPPSRLFRDIAYRALGRAPGPAIRIAALHAVAAVAGAERGTAGAQPPPLLAPAAEEELRAALYEAPTATPCDVLLEYFTQPFLELRVATYRALCALLSRDWVAGAVCSNPTLLDLLLSARSESTQQGCQWRHACVLSLAATILAVLRGEPSNGAGGEQVGRGEQLRAVLSGAAQRVQQAADGGPYAGRDASLVEEFQVATLQRGGGGV